MFFNLFITTAHVNSFLCMQFLTFTPLLKIVQLRKPILVAKFATQMKTTGHISMKLPLIVIQVTGSLSIHLHMLWVDSFASGVAPPSLKM